MKSCRRSLSRWSLGLIVVGALVVSACGDGDSAGDPVPTPGDTPSADNGDDSGDRESIDGQWVLRSGSLDGEEIELVDGRDVTLDIDGDQIGGTAACNGYGGTLAVGDEFESGDSFVVGELGWTEMGCEPEVMELEQRFLRVLGEVDSYELADTLSLARTGVGTSLTFERVVPVADTELVGPTWVLDTLISGDAASNSPGMDAAFLEFSADGTLVGSTGCRRLEGEWSLRGATIRIPVLSAIDDPTAGVCSPESEALDSDIVAVIESGTTVQLDGQIEASRLTLTAPGGDGLSFTARRTDTADDDQVDEVSASETTASETTASDLPDDSTRPSRGTSAELTARRAQLTSYESDGSRVVEMSQGVVSRTGTMLHDSAWFVVDES